MNAEIKPPNWICILYSGHEEIFGDDDMLVIGYEYYKGRRETRLDPSEPSEVEILEILSEDEMKSFNIDNIPKDILDDLKEIVLDAHEELNIEI